LQELVAEIRKRRGPVRFVAVDGPGGSGKSTFAATLSAWADGAPVIHTDDFASVDNPINWWPRLLKQVIEPLANGRSARYQRYDWPTESLAEWITVDPAPIIVIEGVSAARREWSMHLSYVIWIETSRELRLQSAVQRDGEDALDDWEIWMAEEDAHYAQDPTRERADAIIDGATGRAIRAD
jgi:uridine kinase